LAGALEEVITALTGAADQVSVAYSAVEDALCDLYAVEEEGGAPSPYVSELAEALKWALGELSDIIRAIDGLIGELERGGAREG